MNNFYNITRNINFFLNKKYIILVYNFHNVKYFLINNLKKQNYNTKFFFCNNKILFNFIKKNLKKSFYILINKNNNSIFDLIKNIYNLLEIKPVFIFDKNYKINNIPIEKISQISKEFLILKFIKNLKLIIIKLYKTIKKYGKTINK